MMTFRTNSKTIKNKCFFLVAVLLTCCASLNAVENKPAMGKERERYIDIQHISLNMTFNWSSKQARATASISFSPLNTTDRIYLDAAMLSIIAIHLEDGTSLKYKYDESKINDALEVFLNRSYKSNEVVIINVDYHTNYINQSDPANLWGSYGKGLRFFEPTSVEPNKKKQIWSVGEPDGNRYWFPCYDAPDDLRTTEFIATVDNNLTVISNGVLIERTKNTNGTHTFHYKTDVPYANHLTSVVVGEYTNLKQMWENITLNNYSYTDEVEATAASIVRLPDMIKFFSEKTGINYPYPNYSQIFVQDYSSNIGSMMASTITENMVDDYRTHADFYYLWDITEGESVAQQWFGNYVMQKNWSEVWLSKAFARYFSGLYNEYKNGRDEFLIYQNAYDQSMYLADWVAGNRQPVVNEKYEGADLFVNSNYPYLRGSAVLNMLHKQIGDDAWWKAINIYLKTNGGKSVTTKDFINAITQATGKDMNWFFNQWIFKTGHPTFTVTQKFNDSDKTLELVIQQKPLKDSASTFTVTEFFEGNIEIEVDGHIERVWLKPQLKNTFTFNCKQKPLIVNFNYQGTWICETLFEKTLDELLYQFQSDNDIMGKQWAMTQIVQHAKKEHTSVTEKEKIYAALRNVIASNSYWRIRFNALGQLQSLISSSVTGLDSETKSLLLKIIKNDAPWVRRAAIFFLASFNDKQYANMYMSLLNDSSERVINAAAIALGKCKSEKAFDALVALKDKPSWKNQSLISTLWGLKELQDKRGFEIAFNALQDLTSPHWVLATPVWDYRMAAAQTIASLQEGDKAYPFLFNQLKSAMVENDIHGVFYTTLLITTIASPQGMEIFDLLKTKYKNDANTMMVIDQYETQLKEILRK